MTSTMTVWLMEPRDPLLVRDGRPFGSDPGARAISLPFPFPSTIAGGVRARAGVDDDGLFPFTEKDRYAQELQDLKSIQIYGPLLVQLAEESNEIDDDQWLLAAPHDALFLSETAVTGGTAPRLEQLVPLQLPPGAQTDLETDVPLLVGLPHVTDQQKPLQGAPGFWYWKHFHTWLLNPSLLMRQLAQRELSPARLGLRHLVYDHRMHVSIEAGKDIARDGMLFETAGLAFTALDPGNQRLRLAIAVATERQIKEGLAGFGGERRLVVWRKSQARLPACSQELEDAIVATGHCRLLLLTPACFARGYAPTWLRDDTAKKGVQLELKAIALQRPQVVSGWDLALNRPKPSRRLAAAGTVLFLSLQGEEAAIRQWVRDTWMHCISDRGEDRTDGFGLAVLGTWSGQAVPLERGEMQ